MQHKMEISFQFCPAMKLPYAANSTRLIDEEQILQENNSREIWGLGSWSESCRSYRCCRVIRLSCFDNNDNNDNFFLTRNLINKPLHYISIRINSTIAHEWPMGSIAIGFRQI